MADVVLRIGGFVAMVPEGDAAPSSVEVDLGARLSAFAQTIRRAAGKHRAVGVTIPRPALQKWLGELAEVARAAEQLGGVVVVDGLEVRLGETNRGQVIFACRACDGVGCTRCHGAGEFTGRP